MMSSNCNPALAAKRAAEILAEPAPALPPEEIASLADHYFNKRERFLEAAAAHGTPLHLLESPVLRDRAREFKQAFKHMAPAVSYYFAVKCNNNPEVSRIVLENGFGLDVSSGLELDMALDLGANDIVFSGPGKTPAELDLAAAHAGRVTVLMDSFGEMERLEAAASQRGVIVRCGVRLCVDPRGLWRKFGIPLDSLAAFWAKSRHCSHVRLSGLQFHSSWNLSPAPQARFIADIGRTLAKMPGAFLDQLEFLDIGGGYWPPQGEWLQYEGTLQGRLLDVLGMAQDGSQRPCRLSAAPIREFAGQLSQALQEHILSKSPCRVCLEPGRWIVNDAAHLILSVVDKKDADLVITDGGINAVGWERFETDYFPVLNLSRPALEEHPCLVLGSLCTPHDVWGAGYWGEDIQPGDILLIPQQGAYTHSLRQHFIKPLPKPVTI